MEAKQLEKEIQEWATSLGFSLPNQSVLPVNYFAM